MHTLTLTHTLMCPSGGRRVSGGGYQCARGRGRRASGGGHQCARSSRLVVVVGL